jgi:hypothetical protein
VSPLRERLFLAATAVAAIGAPVAAATWVGGRTARLADELGAAAGVPARIGAIDADLTGTVRISDIALGELVAADRVEASVGLESLLDGAPNADEIRVSRPRLVAEVDAAGDSDLGALVRKLSAHRTSSPGSGPTSASRARRIVVTQGSVVARVSGLGELTAEDVELVPDEAGVRVISGAVHVRGDAASGRMGVELAFQRGAADVSLPQLHVTRALAVAGSGTATLGDRSIPLRDVAAGRLARGGPLELRASLDDGGVPRDVAVDVTPGVALSLHGDRIPLGVLSSLAPHGLELDGAHGTGTLAVRRREGGVRVEVDGSVAGVRLDHRMFAPEAIPIDARVHGALETAADGFVVDDTTISLGNASWTIGGWLRRGGTALAGQLDVALAPAPCNDLLASLPAELRGPLDGMEMTGTLGAHGRLAVDLAAPAGDGVQLQLGFDGTCHVVTEPPAADASALAGITEQVFADGSTGRVGHGLPDYIDATQLHPHVLAAFVAAEDAAFWDHHGFDLTQIARSLEIDLREHRIARGGSTISQQLIKNAFLTHRRSLDRKIQEAILTWRLEARLDKKQILGRYLNIIELGPRVFGIGAAAKYWFGVPATQLTVHQAAFLAAMTSEPTSMSRRVRHAGGLDPDSATRVDIVLHGMWVGGAIDANELNAAHAASLDFAPSALSHDD